jgi:hypothetical protein
MRLARAHVDELLMARVGCGSDAQKMPDTLTFDTLNGDKRRPWSV